MRQISDVMADDLEVIRQRILAERKQGGAEPPSSTAAAGQTLTVEEERKAYAELKSRHQIDLNDEHNLADLEDKGLRSHMERARAILADEEKSKAALPSQETIRANHIKNLRQFSALIGALREADLEMQNGVEDTFLQARNAARLGVGEQPHAFPPIPKGKPANSEALAMLGDKTDKAAKACQASSAAVTATIQSLDVLRRESEVVVDTLMKLVDHYRASFAAIERLLTSSKGGEAATTSK